MAEAGRPKIEIDWKVAEGLASIQCTGEEIAAVLKCSYDTLERRLKEEGYKDFADWYGQKAVNGKISLRRRQYDAAKSGNVVMMIWLGKQWLGQSEKQEVEQNQTININIDSDDAGL